MPKRQNGWPKKLNARLKSLISKGLQRPRNENGRRRRRLRSESAVKKKNLIGLQRSKKSAKRKFSANKRSLRRLNVND